MKKKWQPAPTLKTQASQKLYQLLRIATIKTGKCLTRFAANFSAFGMTNQPWTMMTKVLDS
jgi:hypothetical protein